MNPIGRGSLQPSTNACWDNDSTRIAHVATITVRLPNGEVEALNEVAKSMNDSVDRLSSVLVWHALADDGSQGDDYEAYDEADGYDYHGHIPSALSLGFSYDEADKARSLHYFLMATSKKGMPHHGTVVPGAGRSKRCAGVHPSLCDIGSDAPSVRKLRKSTDEHGCPDGCEDGWLDGAVVVVG